MQKLKKIFFAFTKIERIVFLTASALSLTSFVVVMGMLAAQATTIVPAAGGDYTEGMVGQPEYVNPITAMSQTDLSLVKMVYSNLYDIADKVEASPDGRVWTIRLKENLHWQDGEKLTSDDVIFTVQSIQSKDAGSPLFQSWQGVAVSRTSELEFQFSLANPYAFFNDNLNDLYILPKHLFANAPPGNWHLSDYNLKPVGSGPYEFVSYEKRSDGAISAYHLQAWDDYFGTKPLVEHFDFRFFGNESDLVKSFNAGQIDGMGDLGPGTLATIERPYDLSSWRTPSYYAVFFNQSKSLPLEDGAVREALGEAVDRNALVANVLQGKGKPDYGPIPEDAPSFVPIMTTTSLDLASATLDAAGWRAGTDGFRAKTIQKTAVPLVVNLMVPQIDFLVKTAEELQGAWKKIGVRVNIVTNNPQDLLSGTIKNRGYESLLFGNVLGPSSDLYAFWDSSQRFYPGLNLAIYNNKKIDSLIESARMEMNDAARAQKFANAELAIAADNPAIFLYSPDYLYVTNKSIRGITPQFLPDPSDRFRKVGEWYLNTARVLK
ncbi:MAG: peptide ABC transporter substrate-binding protein [Minisyncoccia bacterium]|jgi:peptide/nickel transport system substrate-binding protein